MASTETVPERIARTRFVIVAHRVFPSIVDDLKSYLLENYCPDLWYIIHEFSTLPSRRSYCRRYLKGELFHETESRDYRFLSDPLVNVKDFLFTMAWLLLKVRSSDVYIGLGGFNVLAGLLLRKVLGLKKVVFYTIDFVPVRFENRILNGLYHLIDKLAVRYASETWNLSPRMAEGRQRLKGMAPSDFPNQKVVPIGLWFDGVRRYPLEGINRHELVFIGNIVEKSGLAKVLSAVPAILREIPDFRLRIIGTGPRLERLKRLAIDLGIEEEVVFEGPVPDQREADEMLARAALAVAMYDREMEDFTYYADPGKIKTYLAAGLPVLLTDLPHNALEIQEQGCGKIIRFDEDAIAEAVVEILKDDVTLASYRANVEDYASGFDWNRVFALAFDSVL